MKPDAYMPFYGDKFLRAIKGKPHFIAVGYLKSIWHYWSHTHARGLEDNDDSLRGICELDKEEWLVAKPIIFDNDLFFVQDANGLWHQKRAEEEWQKAVIKYNAAVLGGKNRAANMSKKQRSSIAKKGAAAKWRSKHAC